MTYKRLGCYGERVHQRLRMCTSDLHQELVDQATHGLDRRMDTSNDLRQHLQPRIDAHHLEALQQHGLDLGMAAVLEPEAQQAQGVLQSALRRQGDRAEEALDGGKQMRTHALERCLLVAILALGQLVDSEHGW